MKQVFEFLCLAKDMHLTWTEICSRYRNVNKGEKNKIKIDFHRSNMRQSLKHIEAETKWPPFSRWHFQMHFFRMKNMWISIKILLEFVPKGPINNIPACVQIMAWCRSSDKPLSEPIMVSLLMHICVTWPQWVIGIWPRLGYHCTCSCTSTRQYHAISRHCAKLVICFLHNSFSN